jgi:SAM-dependent methyltransferase
VIPAYSSARRSYVAERMDVEDVGEAEFAACLRDIARINAATNAHVPTLKWLANRWSARGPQAEPYRILDVGSGYGDTLRAIANHARKHNVAVDLVGVDLNPWAARAARAVTQPRDRIAYVTADAFAYEGGPFDAVISSLFTHHIDDERVVTFLRWMHANARDGWFVNDLHRHVLPFAFIALATRALRLHRFVRNDAPLSVARSFRRSEWDALIAKAQLTGAPPIVRWEPLFRYCVSWVR